MRRFRSEFPVLTILIAAGLLLTSCQQPVEEEPAPPAAEKADPDQIAPILDGIGTLDHPITTSNPMAQKFFNQGLTLAYGFNHLEAIRSFEEAARLDPGCAMCLWGQALAHGPNINDPAPDAERETKAHAAAQKAIELSSGASEAEKKAIEALATRYSGDENRDRAALNRAYADAMAELHAAYPDDLDMAVLFAASIMNTMPWDYWMEDGSPKPGIDKVISALEMVMEKAPDHPGAHHYYIHAVEASKDPDRGVASADKLGGLVPVAGHLVHMPSHIYIRVGRYADASEANVKAIAADEDYVTQCRAQGIYPVAYYPHNIHFLWFAQMMEGRGAAALESARKVAGKHGPEHLSEPGFGFPHLLKALPLFTLTRFGMWEQVMAEPDPGDDLVFVRGVRHFARGMALRAGSDLDAAGAELESLKKIQAMPEMEELKIWEANSLASLLQIGVEILSGELSAARGEMDKAVAHLEEAVRIEESLTYSEPKDWPQPARHSWGAVLLAAGKAAEAEKIYREDLTEHRDNGWALVGLLRSLEAQGRTEEAAEVRSRLDRSWARSDIKDRLTASRI